MGEESSNKSTANQLLDSRIVLISGAVDAKLASAVVQQLLVLNDANKTVPIVLMVNSPGGEFHSGFAIYDTIRFIEAPVYSVVFGLAASMGSIIPLAAERRYALPHAKFLIHQPLLMGYRGTASDMEIQAREILRDRSMVVDLYHKYCSRDQKEIEQDIERDKWMNATEAIEYGLIEEVVEYINHIPRGLVNKAEAEEAVAAKN